MARAGPLRLYLLWEFLPFSANFQKQISILESVFLVFFVTKENQVLKLDEKAKINTTTLLTTWCCHFYFDWSFMSIISTSFWNIFFSNTGLYERAKQLFNVGNIATTTISYLVFLFPLSFCALLLYYSTHSTRIY